ncbi:MAG: translation initiation factor IF-2 [Methanosphaera sp.]|uniref:translation initiation factor IF-2 n=1 Tax=Candidatus Methanosphaera massiliense TaxID=3017187 RepID=UPI0023801E65|nr:translation initiation factor IF-2 [Candidatus Methanosphaera massiliense]MDD6286468.1 translation initiation factor IF-2 [Methanobacteriaceae archaeon]MDE4078893.1 translation initiation factor IF-2 [Candidatus Methanosphaera massiliense]MDY2744282.1 translation initiation factor IF-2 [Methanosphaera sp.]
MKTRSPIVSVLGHVDHGKTTLLDNIRGSTIALKEAGGITQHIGATEIPMDVISSICGEYLDKMNIQNELPGLFFVDTPGHEAFTTLRKRGGALADLAILIVDVTEGFKPQTYEALNILKASKTPFVVAANKIDRIPGWNSIPKTSFSKVIKEQHKKVAFELDQKIYELVGILHEEGFESERFDRVNNFASQITIVPTSAVTGEGLSELLTMLIGLAYQYLSEQLQIEETAPASGTVLEVKEEKGLGLTIDTILYDGVLNKNDHIMMLTKDNKVISTKIRSLLKPKPLEEIRESKTLFEDTDHIVAAAGVKVVAPHVDDVVSGSPLRVVNDEKLGIEDELLSEVDNIRIQTNDVGIIVKADTLGSLEALINILDQKDIPIKSAEIGDISRRDIINASIMAEEDEKYGVVIAFNVNILPSAEEELNNDQEVIVFRDSVIYQLTEDYMHWIETAKERQKKQRLNEIVRPSKIRIIPKLVFRHSKPAIAGIEVMSGIIERGVTLINEKGHEVGVVESMEDNGESLQKVSRGSQVAMAIGGAVFEKDFEEGDVLYVDMSERNLFALEDEFGDKLLDDEILTLDELKEIKQNTEDPNWGIIRTDWSELDTLDEDEYEDFY